MTLQGNKSKRSSVTLWGAAGAILGPLAAAAGYTVAPADVAGVINDVGLLVAGAGGVLAWIGRVRATKTVR